MLGPGHFDLADVSNQFLPQCGHILSIFDFASDTLQASPWRDGPVGDLGRPPVRLTPYAPLQRAYGVPSASRPMVAV
jgi:hypothetical protein